MRVQRGEGRGPSKANNWQRMERMKKEQHSSRHWRNSWTVSVGSHAAAAGWTDINQTPSVQLDWPCGLILFYFHACLNSKCWEKVDLGLVLLNVTEFLFFSWRRQIFKNKNRIKDCCHNSPQFSTGSLYNPGQWIIPGHPKQHHPSASLFDGFYDDVKMRETEREHSNEAWSAAALWQLQQQLANVDRQTGKRPLDARQSCCCGWVQPGRNDRTRQVGRQFDAVTVQSALVRTRWVHMCRFRVFRLRQRQVYRPDERPAARLPTGRHQVTYTLWFRFSFYCCHKEKKDLVSVTCWC